MSSYKQFVFHLETKATQADCDSFQDRKPFSYIPGLPFPHYKYESLLKGSVKCGSVKFTERRSVKSGSVKSGSVKFTERRSVKSGSVKFTERRSVKFTQHPG